MATNVPLANLPGQVNYGIRQPQTTLRGGLPSRLTGGSTPAGQAAIISRLNAQNAAQQAEQQRRNDMVAAETARRKAMVDAENARRKAMTDAEAERRRALVSADADRRRAASTGVPTQAMTKGERIAAERAAKSARKQAEYDARDAKRRAEQAARDAKYARNRAELDAKSARKQAEYDARSAERQAKSDAYFARKRGGRDEAPAPAMRGVTSTPARSFSPSPNRPAAALTPPSTTSSFRPSPNRPTAPVQTGVTFRPPAPRPPAPVSSGVTFRPPAPRAPAPVSSGVTFRPASNRPATPSRFDQMMANLPTPVMPVIDRGSFNTNLNNYLADTLAQAGVGNPAAAAGTAQADLNAFDNVGPQDMFQSSPAGDFGGGTAQGDLSALDQADARADAIAAAQDNLADTADARADAADAATNEFADIVGGVGPSARDDLNNLTGTPGGVSDEAVRAYLQNNPNLTDGQIREAMDAFGVAPDQIARVTGLSPAEVQQRYDDAGTARGDLNALPGQAQYTGPTATGPGQVNANIPEVVVPPTATPPVVPPVVQPPGIPPAVPPVVQPPVVQPPVVQPPVVPPVVQPPVVPPVVQPPVVQPPVVQPPVVPPVAPPVAPPVVPQVATATPEAYTGEIPIALARGPAAFSQDTMRPRPDMGAMPLPGGIPSPAAVQLRSGPNAFEDEVLRRGIASIDAPALPEMTSQTIARPSGSMDPHSLGGYKQLSNTFGMTRDRAGNLSAVAQAPSVDAIREGQLTAQMAVPVMPRFFKEGGEAVASPSLLEYIQQQGEEAPIDTDPMGTAQQLLSDVVRVDKRPAPTRQSVKRVSRGAGRDAAATGPMGMKIPSLTESKQMELDTSSSPAESQYKGTAREQMEELARTYQLKINAAKNRARGLAADTFGAPTLEQPTLVKRSLTKRSFAKGGEVKKFNAGGPADSLTPQQIELLAEREAAERDAASRAAFVPPKQSKATRISRENDPTDRIMGVAEPALTLGTGAIAAAVGMPRGIYKGLTSGQVKEGKAASIASKEAADFIERNTYVPRSESGRENLAALSKIAEDLKLAPAPGGAAMASLARPTAVRAQGANIVDDFQQYNRQLEVPGASYAIRQNNPQFISTKLLESTLERATPPDIVGQRPAERLQELRSWFGEEAVDTGVGLSPEVEVPVLRARDAIRREIALDKWVNTTLRKYISRDMATPKDPVREMAEQGILAKVYEDNPGTRETARNRRKELGMDPEGLAQAEAARVWEDAADVSFRSNPADFFMDAGTEASFLADNPWLARLDPNTPITRVGTRMAGEPQDTFQHIVDVLRSDMETGKIRPESLNKLSMADAVKRAHDYNLEKAKAAADARKAAMADRPVYRKYDNDFQWIQLTKPGDFASEADAMGHSVRGYEPVQGSPDWREASGTGGNENYGEGGWEAIKSGRAKIYSLRDPSGEPHGTIEVMAFPSATPAKFRERGINFAEAADAAKRAIGLDPATEAQYVRSLSGKQRQELKQLYEEALAKEFFARTGEMPMENHILQIKGKSNEALSPKYQKYAQDFIQKGNWDSVNDLGNAGLHLGPKGSKGYMTSSEMIDLYESLPDNVRNTGFVQERIGWLKSGKAPGYDFYGSYLYAKDTF